MAQKMDKKLFKRIGDIPNARESWKFVSDAVSSELIGDDVFPLQHIQDGSHYQLGDIVLKEEKSIMDRVLRKTPDAFRAGHLNGFLKPCENEKKNEAVLSSFKNLYEYRDADFNPNYVLVKETTIKGIKKSIRVEVEGCKEAGLMNVPEENSLTVSFAERGLDVFTKFYLISTLYHAQKVRIEVKIQDQTDEYTTCSPNWTIGFKLHKYSINKSGDIEEPIEKTPKNLKIKIIPRFLFPGFPKDHQPPIPSVTPNNDQEPEVQESVHNDVNCEEDRTVI